MTATSSIDLDDIYMTTAELAARWRIAPETLANQRARGEGLPYHKPGGSVLYRVADVLEAERARVFGLSFARIETALRSLPAVDDKLRDKIMLHLRQKLAE